MGGEECEAVLKRYEEAAVGGLLHDVGKVIYRAGILDGDHSSSGYKWLAEAVGDGSADVLDCVRYHHAAKIRDANIAADSPAFAVYIADNIAAGADRRRRAGAENDADERPFQRNLPLDSVFNIMWGGDGSLCYPAADLKRTANYPSDPTTLSSKDYADKAAELKTELSKLFTPEFSGGYINSLLTLLENTFSFVPSSTATQEVADISLYDHSKMTAAAASAICVYLEENNRSDMRKALFKDERAFMDEKAFLMFSCDFSGIQKFIYRVASKNALKSLRSRSFFLELLLEYLMDELLTECGMSRANLIYTGGGHSYALLPNTRETLRSLDIFEKNVNRWLAEQFQSALYLACASRACSGNDLRNEPADKSPYAGIYRDLSRTVAEKKMRRYTADDLRALNSSDCGEGRECKICGVTDNLLKDEEICAWCSRFAAVSNTLLRGDIYAAASDTAPEGTQFFPVPNVFGGGERYIAFLNHEKVIELHKPSAVLRVYSKNNPHTGLNYATNLYMGDYVSSRYMSDLAKDARGIKRIAVLRADVDNLGLAFTNGFERMGDKPAAERDIYKTLSRSAEFSRQMSMFFKYHINSILDGTDDNLDYFSLGGEQGSGGKNALVVYSGGDDIFVVGAWSDVLEAAVDIHNALEKFTGGALTISAGISVCGAKYPIYKSAAESALLEAASKRLDGKDGITLFADGGEYTYKWKDFMESVLPKYRMLEGFLGEGSERGMAFLYRVLELLRGADEKINIARCAYMLARLEPKDKGARKNIYREFSKSVYGWMTEPKGRRELITAIQIYVYMHRRED